MMDETTPTNRTPKLRYVPTPKLSERKKRLFDENDDGSKSASAFSTLAITEEEDSDLGPMSQLEFSSSPTTFNKIMGSTPADYIVEEKVCSKPRTDFLNVLMPSNSPKTPSNRRGTNREANAKDSDEMMTKKALTVHVDGIEHHMRDCVVVLEKENYAAQLKTPNELGSSTKPSDPLHRGRKSLIFDSGLTPSDSGASLSGKTADSNETIPTNEQHPKAKASLSFSEPLFSAKSFYGVQKDATASTSKSNEVLLPSRMPLKTFSVVASKPLKKQASRKSTLFKGPSLWRHGGKVSKIRKLFKKPVKKVPKKPEAKMAIAANQSVEASKENESETAAETAEDAKKRQEQIDRNHKSFKMAAKGASCSIDGNACASTNQSQFGEGEDDDDDSSSNSDDDDQEGGHWAKENTVPDTSAATEAEPETISKPRKFFKSSTNNVKSYKIIDGIRATMKRGCDLQLERPVKRIKRKRNTEKVVLHNEISSIIDRLSSPQKERDNSMTAVSPVPTPMETTASALPARLVPETVTEPIPVTFENNIIADVVEDGAEKYRKMLPYNTNDAAKISQQESVLDLLILNGICNDETFKIFIAEEDLHKAEASRILDELTICVNETMGEDVIGGIDGSQMPSTSGIQNDLVLQNDVVANETDDGYLNDVQMSPASQISNMTLSLAIDCASEENEEAVNAEKLFPIFNKDGMKPAETNKILFEGMEQTTKKWKGTGMGQLQIDAGQKEFGMKVCPQCEMTYNVHEAEDEIIHNRYHNAVNTLAFKGWTQERLITELPEWGLGGRIILLGEKDNKAKKKRVLEILAVVDRDLGFSTQTLPPKSLVYMGIAKNQVIGLCVAQPLNEANRMANENGLDCCTKEAFPVKCGISRIWVAPPFRRFGVARSMITTVRNNFVFGGSLSMDDIAFSSPTEAGKQLAAKLTGRMDFLVYER